jgi:hypothetical protein
MGRVSGNYAELREQKAHSGPGSISVTLSPCGTPVVPAAWEVGGGTGPASERQVNRDAGRWHGPGPAGPELLCSPQGGAAPKLRGAGSRGLGGEAARVTAGQREGRDLTYEFLTPGSFPRLRMPDWGGPLCTHARAHPPTHASTYTRAPTHTQARTRAHAHPHTPTHTHTHTHASTYARTHTHTHAHTHAQRCWRELSVNDLLMEAWGTEHPAFHLQ